MADQQAAAGKPVVADDERPDLFVHRLDHAARGIRIVGSLQGTWRSTGWSSPEVRHINVNDAVHQSSVERIVGTGVITQAG